jgi:hypothetical protein
VWSFPIDRSSSTIIAHAGGGIYLDLALKLEMPGFCPTLGADHPCSLVMPRPLARQKEPRR